jgi:hypothetical protein
MQQAKDPLARYREQLIARYAEQRVALRDAMQSWQESQLHSPVAPGEWSPHQILAHVAAADVYAFVPRLKRIAAEENPELQSWDEGAWMDADYDPETSAESWLGSFEAARREGLDLIKGLAEDGWSRTGRHPSQGERTLQWWLEYSVNHVDDHLNQLRPPS